MDAKTRSSLEAISNATVSMQLLKRGIRSVSMAGPKPMNTPTKPIVGEALQVFVDRPIRTRLDKVDTKHGAVFLGAPNKAKTPVRL